MKKQLIGLGVAALMFGAGSAGAVLWTNATDASLMEGIVYDDDAKQYWYQNLSDWKYQTYDTQINGIADLNVAGSTFLSEDWDNWHMADFTDMNNLWAHSTESIIEAFTPVYVTTRASYSSRYNKEEYNLLYPAHYVGSIYDNLDGTVVKHPLLGGTTFDYMERAQGAWVVADATPTPEPATILLFGAGLAGLVGLRIRRSKKK